MPRGKGTKDRELSPDTIRPYLCATEFFQMKKTISIIGSGPAALMLAAHLDENRFEIHLYEKNAAPARKFLVAGDGGFNLTHSEETETFITRYSPAGFLDETIRAFTNEDLIRFLKSIGIPTYAGSSKRVFPEKGIKPIEVLNALLDVLKKKNVQLHLKHEWKGWENDALLFESDGELKKMVSDYTVFALGGASWPVTGSDGGWTKLFREKQIVLVPFQSSNCAMQVHWPEEFITAQEGKPLKNIAVRCGNKEKKGELVITRFGLEGGAIYFHSPCIRKQLNENGSAEIKIDLRPDLSSDAVLKKLEQASPRQSRTEVLKKELGFDALRIALLKSVLTKDEFIQNGKMAAAIKAVPVQINALGPMEDAISVSGGIALEEIDNEFQLKKMPGTFVAGEMLDWDAPTGGYLLQACFSMGYGIAKRLNGAN